MSKLDVILDELSRDSAIALARDGYKADIKALVLELIGEDVRPEKGYAVDLNAEHDCPVCQNKKLAELRTKVGAL